MDAWFEEDDEVFVHPRDPYHRVDVLHGSRHVKIVVGGEVVAETSRQPTRRPAAPTRARRPTGPSTSTAKSSPTSSGAIRRRSRSARRSRTCSASTTRKSTPSTSTASYSQSPLHPGPNLDIALPLWGRAAWGLRPGGIGSS
jgi:hypothetical protein